MTDHNENQGATVDRIIERDIPTDDEREALAEAAYSSKPFYETGHNPWPQSFRNAFMEGWDARGSTYTHVCPEPQGEPSSEVPEPSTDWYDLAVKAFPWDASEGDAVLDARRRMVQVLTDNFPEPCAECPQCHRPDGLHKLGCGERFGSEPQGEPSDAQVQAALRAYWGGVENARSHGSAYGMRAALRDANEVR